ncbi:shikimate dehydrogenase [Seohaeicola zhoushanensis]|uniref:Shikimate dehydrogenase (NADP(+)) n=1 Tax=Seohaeicola zhoushanensis TaxID=1569283 RepID=A0A8J3GZF1_9RHOB|nr:shikimate dehydrogenase [Seohaeicola zhoushanensis]GHF56522.1 shikimate dehydrogenase (NADP(+)) [Seohaeicola zhoushanensis]
MTTARVFVIGHPIGHSRSPMMHGYWIARHGLDATYEKRDVAPEDLGAFVRQFRAEGWTGCNLTIPHKREVMAHVDSIDPAAEAMGAVNCLWWEENRLIGGNTDAYGLIAHLDNSRPGWDRGASRAVVLGAGGAARAATWGLRQRGLEVDLCNRTASKAETLADELGTGVAGHGTDQLAELLAGADVLVNTTSLGMIGQPPLDLDLGPMPAHGVVYDVVYAPLETDLLKRAAARGLGTVDGLGMLLHQGAKGFERWFGVMPEVTPELRRMLEDDIRADLAKH